MVMAKVGVHPNPTGFTRILRDISYSFPFLRNFISFLIEFVESLYKPIVPNQSTTRFDLMMGTLTYIIFNGLLILLVLVLLLGIPFRLDWLLGLGMLRYLARDVADNFLWKPVCKVASLIKLR